MDLNTTLIILGIVALIALIAHGLWANRREKSQYFENRNIFKADSRQVLRTDNISPVISQTKMETSQLAQPVSQKEEIIKPQPTIFENKVNLQAPSEQVTTVEPKTVEQIKIKLPDNQQPIYQMQREEYRTQPMPSFGQDIAQFTIADVENKIDEEEGFNTSVEQLRVQLQEVAQTNMFNQSVISSAPLQQPIEESTDPVQEEFTDLIEAEEPSFIMLYVVAAENQQFHGSELSQALEDLGFIFGKGSIYHRHLDLSVASPILFSAANINQPGTFDIYHLNEFYTVGIVLFMQLPSEGNDRANLKMMIRAAKTLAEQLNGFVLTEEQEVFTELAEQEYLGKLK